MRLNRILLDQSSMGVNSAVNGICNGPNRTELMRVDESIKTCRILPRFLPGETE
jgi:hypothetical protein